MEWCKRENRLRQLLSEQKKRRELSQRRKKEHIECAQTTATRRQWRAATQQKATRRNLTNLLQVKLNCFLLNNGINSAYTLSHFQCARFTRYNKFYSLQCQPKCPLYRQSIHDELRIGKQLRKATKILTTTTKKEFICTYFSQIFRLWRNRTLETKHA